MWCTKCSYYVDEPDGAVCQRCGRYLQNKAGEIALTCALAAALALFSHYVLVGKLFSGPRLIWVQTALSAPYSVYESPPYDVTVAATLTGIGGIVVLAGFHYGAAVGLIIGLVSGVFCAVEGAIVVLPAVGLVASAGRLPRLPPLLWSTVAAGLAGLLYISLAYKFGPHDPVYRTALYRFLFMVGALVVVVVLLETLFAASIGYRSAQVAVVAAVLAAAPMGVFFGKIGPAQFQAGRLRILYDPTRMLNSELPRGFVTGMARTDKRDFAPGKQLGHVFDTTEYVDWVRQEAVTACDRYVKGFGDNEYAPEIMLLEAEMMNAKVDFHALTKLGRLETYYDRMGAESTGIYGEIIRRFPGTPQCALARFYLAEGTFQAGKSVDAMRLYAQAQEALAAWVPEDFQPAPAQPPPASVGDLYRADEGDRESLEARLYGALLTARRREALIADNSDFGGQALARLAGLDARSEQFDEDARALVAAYPDSRLVDNVKLTLAKRTDVPAERAAQIEGLLAEYPSSDVRDEMLYEYARALYLSNLAGKGAFSARPVLERLLSDFPASTYAGEGRRLLEKVRAAISARAGVLKRLTGEDEASGAP